MKLGSFVVSLGFFLLASGASATIIPADALVNFQVNAFAPVGNGPYTAHVAAWMASPAGHGAPYGTPEGNVGPDGQRDAVGPDALANLPLSSYALVGKIGQDLGDEFLIGSSLSGVANDTGVLYLAFNDTHYFDNSGFVIVNTAPVPEPSTSLLLGLALAGLATRQRRSAKRKRSHSARDSSLGGC